MTDKTIIRQRSLPYITQVENIFHTSTVHIKLLIFQSQSQFKVSKPTFFGSGHMFNSKFVSEPCKQF